MAASNPICCSGFLFSYMAGDRVLSIAYDPTLSKIRELILERAGYQVHSVIGNEAGILAAQKHNFDLFILGNTAEYAVRQEMANFLKSYSQQTPLIALKRFEYEAPIEGADCASATMDPSLWLKTVSDCLAK
ncbi:MAG TPA: hypothetical protein VFA71_12785 [Terriglobales bacterium]|nr:hypothetical protein [Terriglobales bacterium]